MSGIGKILGGILLVAGTTIGAAILALPVSTGLMGFFPTILLLLLYWLFMTFTGLLFLEVNLWLEEEDVNLISMAKATLGRWGEAVGWVFYLFLLYALTTAYLAESGPLFLNVMEWGLGIDIPKWVAPLPLLVLFSFFVIEGARAVDYLNRFLMIGLVCTYFLLSFQLMPYIQGEFLEWADWGAFHFSVPLIATAFGYHIIIPTLTRYLHHDAKSLRTVILLGSFVPVVVYIFWEYVALGVIPLEALAEGYAEGRSAVYLLVDQLHNPWIAVFAQCFLFFAIVTSFLGVSISLRDFLADGLHIKKNKKGRALLYVLTFLPPLLIGLSFKRIFFTALDYAGAYGVVTLLAIMPALMVWEGRYRRGYGPEHYRAPGGKIALVLVFLFSLFVILVQIGNDSGFFL